ncbi:hypothetical protein [Nonomuraea longicatena]|uniref:Knr4/Smi1-like domain-containing protein n=1 Tax=Nonomuraea longicatena TaxID=83682 RepID=A0ABP3ZKF3_9ACTN
MTDVFSPIPELNLLKEFYDATIDEWWGNGFEMYEFGKDMYQDRDPRLADRLVYFAQANGSGSMYGIWRKDDREDLATLPVIAAGDEGGLHLVARNLREFFQLLGAFSRDAQPFIDWESFFYPDDSEPVPNGRYLAWLEQTFDLPPVDDWESIVVRAQAELGQEWAAWIHPIIPDVAWSPIHELNLFQQYLENFSCDVEPLETYGVAEELTNPHVSAGLTPFAATETDTYFALWHADDVADVPVVALGATSGAHVVARNLREFYRLLAGLTDTEIRHDGTRLDFRPRERARDHKRLRAWLEETFALPPADDPTAVVTEAQTDLGERLATRLDILANSSNAASESPPNKKIT